LGNFDVKITIKNYVLGGTGYLQNKKMKLVLVTKIKVCGQCAKESKNVDILMHPWFMILLGQQIRLYSRCGKDLMVSTSISCIKQPTIYSELENLQPKTVTVNGDLQQVGDYPYKQYSVIQGGDGGMEYAMCTLI
jgi:hypothetical protein